MWLQSITQWIKVTITSFIKLGAFHFSRLPRPGKLGNLPATAPNVGGTQASPSKSPVIEAGASRRSSSGGDLPSLDWETDPNPFVQHRANGDKYQ